MKSCTFLHAEEEEEEINLQGKMTILELFQVPIQKEFRNYVPKRLYILLNEVHNYRTQLIGERHRNELKSDRKNGTLTFTNLRVI